MRSSHFELESDDDGVSYANYQAPVFCLDLAGRVVLDNQSKTAKQLHTYCYRNDIRLPIPEGVPGFVSVDIHVAVAAKILE